MNENNEIKDALFNRFNILNFLNLFSLSPLCSLLFNPPSVA